MRPFRCDGIVAGFDANGAAVPPYSNVAGLPERATDAAPFALPQSWLAAKPKLSATMPLDLVTTNDIIGGISGSPLVDRNGRIVGLIFDGNEYALAGDFGYDVVRGRAIAVDSRALLAGLPTVSHANRFVREIHAAAKEARAYGSVSRNVRTNEHAGSMKRSGVVTRTGTWVLAVAIVGSSMAFIDSTAVNVALPSIQRDLQSDAAGLQWVIEGYALFASALILIGGSLGDVFGRRRIFVLGIALFAIASLACAFAQTTLELNIARCIQGSGGALATPGSLALISANFDDAERGRAIGTWSGFAAITTAIGPLLGGWLAQTTSWRTVFLINVPFALFVIVAATLRVPESRDVSGGRTIDTAGAILATTALGALTFGLIRLQGTPRDALGLASCGASIVLFAAFVTWQYRARAPMIAPALFRNRTFTGANLYTLFLYAALGGSFFFVPFDLQNVQGYTPSAAGAAMLPFIVIMFVLSRWSGGLVASVGARLPLITGAIVAGFGFLAYARIGIGGSYWTTFFPAAVISGVGGALFVAPLTTTVMQSLETAHAGIASGVNNAVSRVASLLAIAALGIVLSNSLYTSFDASPALRHISAASRATLARDRPALGSGRTPPGLLEPDRTRIATALRTAYTLGFRRSMLISALLSWLAAVIALSTVAGRKSNRSARAPAPLHPDDGVAQP